MTNRVQLGIFPITLTTLAAIIKSEEHVPLDIVFWYLMLTSMVYQDSSEVKITSSMGRNHCC